MKVATDRDDIRPKARLYHGSNVEVKKPSLRMGRKKTDFGRGFYTTTQKEQAEHWTSIKLDRAKKAGPSIFTVLAIFLMNKFTSS